MRWNAYLWLVALATLLLSGCATLEGLPQGSVLAGSYEGPFNGKFIWGTIRVRVYDTPRGYRPVLGQLDQDASVGTAIFRGEMTGSRLEAQFTLANGTVTGELAADGSSMTGRFRFVDALGEEGTWSAQRTAQ